MPTRNRKSVYGISAASRTLRLLARLHTHGMTVREMANREDVSLKTIRRLLIAIQRAGWVLEVEVEEHGRKVYRCRGFGNVRKR